MDESKQIEEKLKLENQFKGGVGWFYWIAGLSIINTAIMLFGGKWSFIVGLGVTQVIDAVALNIGPAAKPVAAFLDLLVAGVFVLFGVLAGKRYTWAIVVGMALYGLDGLLFILVKDFLGLAFHGYALFCIWNGLRALQKLSPLPAGAPPAAPIEPHPTG
jgi:hypothetical protein